MKLTSMVGIIAIGIVLTPKMTVLAAPTTNSKVIFSEGEVTGDIVRPDDAAGELIIPQPEGVKPTGSLAITYAPSFDFGEQKISTKKETYFAKSMLFYDKKDTGKNNPKYMPSILAVEDARGSKAGWTVSVSASPFVGNTPETSQKILKNATITFLMGKQVYNTADPDPGELVIDGRYDVHEADGDIVIETSGTQLNPIPAPKDILTAFSGQGAAGTRVVFNQLYTGTLSSDKPSVWTKDTLNSNIVLTVPPSAGAEKNVQYTSDLTWELTAAPK